jgi:farnesyl diphosphate synthase
MIDFEAEMAACATDVERALDIRLSAAGLSGPGVAPAGLIAAMRHGALGGGKRLRPLLVRQAAAIFGVGPQQSLAAGLAVECIHCYSLIHDDLPAMDDDDLRRGKPTVHKAFDEATAILAGDALLTEAFLLLAEEEAHPDLAVRLLLVTELGRGAGSGGMVGGQMRDLDAETARPSEREIAELQAQKTGALIRAAVRMGAILGGAGDVTLGHLTTFAEVAGRAFQLADDILDVTASADTLGKTAGKDAKRGKATLVERFGVPTARRHLGDLVHDALTELTMFGPEANGLRSTARYFATREN